MRKSRIELEQVRVSSGLRLEKKDQVTPPETSQDIVLDVFNRFSTFLDEIRESLINDHSGSLKSALLRKFDATIYQPYQKFFVEANRFLEIEIALFGNSLDEQHVTKIPESKETSQRSVLYIVLNYKCQQLAHELLTNCSAKNRTSGVVQIPQEETVYKIIKIYFDHPLSYANYTTPLSKSQELTRLPYQQALALASAMIEYYVRAAPTDSTNESYLSNFSSSFLQACKPTISLDSPEFVALLETHGVTKKDVEQWQNWGLQVYQNFQNMQTHIHHLLEKPALSAEQNQLITEYASSFSSVLEHELFHLLPILGVKSMQTFHRAIRILSQAKWRKLVPALKQVELKDMLEEAITVHIKDYFEVEEKMLADIELIMQEHATDSLLEQHTQIIDDFLVVANHSPRYCPLSPLSMRSDENGKELASFYFEKSKNGSIYYLSLHRVDWTFVIAVNSKTRHIDWNRLLPIQDSNPEACTSVLLLLDQATKHLLHNHKPKKAILHSATEPRLKGPRRDEHTPITVNRLFTDDHAEDTAQFERNKTYDSQPAVKYVIDNLDDFFSDPKQIKKLPTNQLTLCKRKLSSISPTKLQSMQLPLAGRTCYRYKIGWSYRAILVDAENSSNGAHHFELVLLEHRNTVYDTLEKMQR